MKTLGFAEVECRECEKTIAYVEMFEGESFIREVYCPGCIEEMEKESGNGDD